MKAFLAKPTSMVLALSLLLAFSSARGMSALGRSRTGRVIAVDVAKQTMTVAPGGEGQVRTYRWDQRTRFVSGVGFIRAEAVPPGATVTYIYRDPWIGDPVITKVTVGDEGQGEVGTTRRTSCCP